MYIKKQIALIKQLLYLLATIRNGKISRAAEETGMKISNLSAMLKELEQELGVQLIKRMSDGVVPTQTGLELSTLAENIEKLLNEITDIRKASSEYPILNFYKPQNLDVNMKDSSFGRAVNVIAHPLDYDVAILPERPMDGNNLYATKVVIETNLLNSVWWVVSDTKKPLAAEFHKFLVNSMM